ncbi:MAG: DUF4838 domain-containing protein [Saprospiraceae bacterium]|nr:DUF4838 domain-containing protein [Saprospiraceae bacterium]
MIRLPVFLALYLFFQTALFSQQPTVWLASTPSEPDKRAAFVLQDYLSRITLGKIEVFMTDDKPTGVTPVFVGNHPALSAYGYTFPTGMPDDAYFLQGIKGSFFIAGDGEMGAEYGVYDLLERLGCRYYSPRDLVIPNTTNLQLPQLQATTVKPAFPYRELHYEPAFDASWAKWHKLKTRQQKSDAWGMFVHTFEQLCPADVYFDTHPEYFSWNGAQRSPGQLCLSNDTVLNIVVKSLRQKTAEKPEAKFWSVSQNDNYDYCKCSRCAASDKRYNSPSGTLIAFVNKVAAAFPEITISTLAYQYTRQAPKGITPVSNVNICLCSIECGRGKTIEDGCPDFARDVREWSALTSNLMIWDYVVQFRSYVSPFPNWHTLQPNLQFFQQNRVQMMFEQGSGGVRSEFSDMRAYLLAKLMWNPQTDMDSVLVDFGKGYYGSLYTVVWDYIHELTESLKRNGSQLGIYDIPQNEPFISDTAFLNSKAYKRLRDYASMDRSHIREAWIPMHFALLEIVKKDTALLNKPAILVMELHEFVEECKQAGFVTLHERNLPPVIYHEQYVEYLEKYRRSRDSRSTSIQLAEPASNTYAKGNPMVLTDRLVGETDYRSNWLGFQGKDMSATVAVSGETPVSEIRVSFLQDQEAWVFYPVQVRMETSADGVAFTEVFNTKISLVPAGKKAVQDVVCTLKTPINARLVRVTAVNSKTCPSWHTCNGNPCWIFADEIVVK